ncbi:MAG: hypothetical protein IKC64_04355 [Clostridia bacterium]|nr:hypothetical protein [Clostridia bacterium]
MKRLVYLVVTTIYITLALDFNTGFANANSVKINYALIGQNAVLYREIGGELSPVTSLPSSYFVALLGEENDGFFRVSYLDIDGFMQSSDIELVDYTPKFKYAENAQLTVTNDGHPVNFRATPTSTGKVLATINSGDTLYYYGQVSGEASNELIGNTWYYARYIRSDGTSLYGYIYSLYSLASPVPPNDIVAESPPSQTVTPNVSSSGFSSGQTREIVIIVSLCLPVLAIAYLIFRNEKRL